MSTHIKFTLSMLTDWHIGTGAGTPGVADRDTRKDQHGIPQLNARALYGVWRDACEQAAAALDLTWNPWVDTIFGHQPDASKGAVQGGSAVFDIVEIDYSSEVRAKLEAHRFLRDACTAVRPGISIDPKTGLSKLDHLRFTEVAAGGATLHGIARLNTDAASANTALALLWAGSKLLRRIGGDRRRGLGQVELKIDSCDEKKCLELLKTPASAMTTANAESAGLATDSVSAAVASIATSAAAIHLSLELSLLSPVIVASRVLGNVIESHDHIPGTQILPALMPTLTKLAGDKAALLRNLIAQGELQIRNAYPAHKSTRLLPIPMGLHQEKMSGEVVNLFAGESSEHQLKQLRSGFVSLSNSGSPILKLAQTQLGQYTHSVIDDEFQRPTSEVGGVVTYEAISAGQVMIAEIWLSAKANQQLGWTLESLKRALPAEIRIGTTKKNDYGRCKVSAVVGAKSPTAPAFCKAGEQDMLIVCGSDWLLHDTYLRPRSDPEAIKAALALAVKNAAEQVNKEKVSEEFAKVTIGLSYLRSRRTEGFHVPSQLARPSYIGLSAGSCLVLDFTNGISSELSAELSAALNKLAAHGIGARCAEGFGEFANFSALKTAKSIKLEKCSAKVTASPALSTATIDANNRNWLDAINIQAAQAWLQKRALEIATDSFISGALKWSKGKSPSKSQLGLLRAALLAEPFGLNAWLAWIELPNAPAERTEAWAQAKVFWKTLKADPSVIWIHFREPPPLWRPELKSDLTTHAARALFIACFTRFSREVEGNTAQSQLIGEPT